MGRDLAKSSLWKRRRSAKQLSRCSVVLLVVLLVSLIVATGNLLYMRAYRGVTTTPQHSTIVESLNSAGPARHHMDELKIKRMALEMKGVQNEMNTSAILMIINELKSDVQKLRASKKVKMPIDAGAVELTTRLQNATRCYLSRVLDEQYLKKTIVAILLKFPRHMVDSDEWLKASADETGQITLYVELAPALLLPHAFYTIMQITKTFQSGHFHRNAGHVLQSSVKATYTGGVVFMEYDRLFPHEKYSLGFAGRGGGSAFYISTQNNTMIHGPGTDRGGKDPESDTSFGLIIPGYNGEKIVQSMQKQSGKMNRNGFVQNKKNFITISSMRLLTSADLAKEMGNPAKIKLSKYSMRLRQLKDQRDSIHYASATEYCSHFLN